MSITKKEAAHQFKAEALSSQSWSITNLSNTDIIVISNVAKEGSTIEQFFEQSLTILETADGQKAIKAGSVATINLDAKDYSIIIVRAEDLYPVKTAELVFNAEAQTFPSQTITTGDAANMQLAEKLKKLIAVFPKSAMAQDYQTLLSGNDPAKAAAFFKKYEEYKSLTIDMIVAIETYYNVYPFAWAGYAKAKTYHLYTSDGTANKKLGSVILTNACSVPVDTNKALPGFTITYINGTTIKPLSYVNGQFVDDASNKSPAICLQGLFVLKSALTSISADNQVISIVSGTVNGQPAMGYDEGNGSNVSTLDKLLNPQCLADWLKFCGILLGGLIVTGLLAMLLKKTFDAIRKSGAGELTQEEWDKLHTDFLKEQAEAMKTDQDYLDRLALTESFKLPENFEDYSKLAENEIIKVTYEADMKNITDVWAKQNECCEMALKYGNNSEMGKISYSLKDIKDWLNTNPDVASLSKNLSDTMTQFKTNSDLLAKEWAPIKNKHSADMIAMDKTVRQIEDITNKVQENEKQREDWKKEKIPEDTIVEK